MSIRAPFLVILFLLCVAILGCGEGASPAGGREAPRGAVYYASICGKCHGSDGQGVGNSFPPLAGSEWVTGDEELLIRIVLYGLQGPIEVQGEPYRGLMVGFERQLGDEHVAEILTYIRSSWGNEAPAVKPSLVSKVRQQPNPGRPLRAEDLSQKAGELP